MNTEELRGLVGHFNVEMIKKLKDVPGIKTYWTGSRVIGGYSESSDVDLVVYGDNADVILEELFDYGLIRTGSTDSDPLKSFVSYETFDFYVPINFIVTHSEEQFSKWKTATEVAKGLQLHRKEDRIALFDSIFGKPDLATELPF